MCRVAAVVRRVLRKCVVPHAGLAKKRYWKRKLKKFDIIARSGGRNASLHAVAMHDIAIA